MSIYHFDNYKNFVKSVLSERPNQGYGQMGKLAKFLGVTSTLTSQILNGSKHFTPEQAERTCQFLGLSLPEQDYLLTMVMAERAGTLTLQNFFKEKLKSMREQGRQLQAVAKHRVFSQEEQAVFYSDWIFSAVRQMPSIPGCGSIDLIAERMRLDRALVKKVVDFLIEAGLLRHVDQKLVVGPASTHLDRHSPWVRVHHNNWRNKALEAMSQKRHEDLFFTMPTTLSARDFLVVREHIQKAVENVLTLIDASPSEHLACLNFDWFKV